jgi:hypothetical protein
MPGDFDDCVPVVLKVPVVAAVPDEEEKARVPVGPGRSK